MESSQEAKDKRKARTYNFSRRRLIERLETELNLAVRVVWTFASCARNCICFPHCAVQSVFVCSRMYTTLQHEYITHVRAARVAASRALHNHVRHSGSFTDSRIQVPGPVWASESLQKPFCS